MVVYDRLQINAPLFVMYTAGICVAAIRPQWLLLAIWVIMLTALSVARVRVIKLEGWGRLRRSTFFGLTSTTIELDEVTDVAIQAMRLFPFSRERDAWWNIRVGTQIRLTLTYGRTTAIQANDPQRLFDAVQRVRAAAA
jgi:hypothetical protein